MRPATAEMAELARDLAKVAYLEGDFVLRSGRHSKYYFDKYLFETEPQILRRVCRQLARLLPPETQRLAAPELGAILLGGGVSLETDLPLVLVRQQAKGYGTGNAMEGRLLPGERVTVIEDVLTTGGAAIEAVKKLREAGADVIALLGVLDREEGAAENIAQLQVPFTALFRRTDLVPGGSGD